MYVGSPSRSGVIPSLFSYFFFFFFQAEDGIRDDLVTGVQTCALPISFEPVNPMYRVFGCCTITSPITAPDPVKNCTASFGTPASCKMSTNFAAIVGESAAGCNTTGLPVTSDPTISPALIALSKFQGGMNA